MGKKKIPKKEGEEVVIIDVDEDEEHRDWLRPHKVKPSDKNVRPSSY
jgi:hypothetical protein